MRGRRSAAGRRTLVAVLVAGMGGTAAGCGGLPTRSDVRVVRTVAADEPRADVELRRIPAEPLAGQTPVEVVEGFLRAGADLAVARLFLAQGSTPLDGEDAVVFDDPPTAMEIGPSPRTNDTTVIASVDPVLLITAEGAPRAVQPKRSGALRLSITLHRDASNGQWRITSRPPVLPLRARDLPQARRAVSVAWRSADRVRLVREPLLLPVSGDDVLSVTMKALLAGPTPRLRAAGLATALPEGTLTSLVTRVDDEVVVDLQLQGRRIPPEDAATARAQVAATLLSLPGVDRVRVRVDGTPLVPTGVRDDGSVTAADVAAFDAAAAGGAARPEPYVVGAGERVLPLSAETRPLSPPTTTSLPPTSSPTAAPAGRRPPGGLPSAGPPAAGTAPVGAVTALAIGPGARPTVTLRGSGDTVIVQLAPTPDGVPVALDQPGPWTSAGWSRDGSLWLVRGGQVLVRRLGGGLAQVTVQARPAVLGYGGSVPGAAPDAPALRTLTVAADGVHAVGLSTTGTLVAGLVSADASLLTDLHPVLPSVTGITALALADDGGTTALIAHADGVVRVGIAASDPGDLRAVATDLPTACPPRGTGAATPSPAPSPTLSAGAGAGGGGVQVLAATPGEQPLVGCADGRVRRLSGGTWELAGGGRLPTWSLG